MTHSNYPEEWLVKAFNPNDTQPIPGLSDKLQNIQAIKEIIDLRKSKVEAELGERQKDLVAVATKDMTALRNHHGGWSCESKRDYWTSLLVRDMFVENIAPGMLQPSSVGYLHLSQTITEKLDAMPGQIERPYNDGIDSNVAVRIKSEMRRAVHNDETLLQFAIQNGTGQLRVPVAAMPLVLPPGMQGPPAIRDHRSFGKLFVTTLPPLQTHTQKALEEVVTYAMDLVSSAHTAITAVYSTGDKKTYYS